MNMSNNLSKLLTKIKELEADREKSSIDQVLLKDLEDFKMARQAGSRFRALDHAWDFFSALIDEVERLQFLDAELKRARARNTLLESRLKSSIDVMDEMREQITQMSGMFDDEDGAILAACSLHDDFKMSAGVMS
jgi:RNAse (barnase) inhibitor barstar